MANDLSTKELTDVISEAFLEPFQEYRLSKPLAPLPINEESPIPEVSEHRIHLRLAKLNLSKACGPDDIPNYVLKDYADLIFFPASKSLFSKNSVFPGCGS